MAPKADIKFNPFNCLNKNKYDIYTLIIYLVFDLKI